MIKEKTLEVNKLITHLYENKTGILKSYKDIDIPTHETNFSSGYGEIKFDAIFEIIKNINFEEDDVFLDLGCGIGRFCLEIFLTTKIKKVIGVELERNRFNIAQETKNKLQKYLSKKNKSTRELLFYNENINNFDINQANVIYLCSLCFPQKLIQIITNKLEEHPRLKAVISFNKLNTPSLKLKNKITIPTTWSNNETIYFYSSSYFS
mgnify:CR=1 FL=1